MGNIRFRNVTSLSKKVFSRTRIWILEVRTPEPWGLSGKIAVLPK